MYHYDDYDQSLIEQRSREYREQVKRRLDGLISEEEFKPLRLMNGLYMQLHAYMLRVAVPYGVLSSAQMRQLAFIADRFDRGYGHFTTRQNIQFNWLKLEDTPEILDHLASVQMHAIQTSGNCIRNITTDPFAGVAEDESVDPRPLCELLRQWSTLHPEFAYLPRKFKIAVTGASVDRAAIKVHDIGLQLKRLSDDRVVVEVWIGGGQGRTPKIAQLLKNNVGINDLLPYMEAVMRVYNQYGRRDNKYKARIKILVSETGIDALREDIDEEYHALERTGTIDVEAELARIEGRFHSAASRAGDGIDPFANPVDPTVVLDAEFQIWKRQNVKAHKTSGYANAVVSLKPVGGIPGDASADQMRVIADLAERYAGSEIRVTHRQNLVLPEVRTDDLYLLWQDLAAAELAEANVDLPSDIIACPGLDYCSLATARSIPIAQSISTRIRSQENREDEALSGVSVNISGCINACGHHHVADIGILGLDRAGVENYQITLGGKNDTDARIAERQGPGLSADEVAPAVERVIDLYLNTRTDGERFSDTYQRLGKVEFKDAVYGKDDQRETA